MLWGCSAGSGRVFRCPAAVVHGPEWGRGQGTAVVDVHIVNDVAGHVGA